MNRRRWLLVGGGVLVVLVALVAFGTWWFFFRDDAPAAVSLDQAVEAAGGGTSTTGQPDSTASAQGEPGESSTTTAATTATTTATTGDATGDASDGSAAAGIDGTWLVDTSIGSFDFDSADGSFVGFRVSEELTIGSQTAVGRTGDVAGSLTIDGTTVSDVTIEADLSQLVTNDSRRDRAARGALDTEQFPLATFVQTQPLEIPADAAAGGPVSVTAVGDLTIHGVTQSVEVPIQAQLVDDVIALIGSLPVSFADYGVTAPSAPIVVSVEDNGTIEFQLLFTRS
jgi:polyisoprenoid-binding protein YceI